MGILESRLISRRAMVLLVLVLVPPLGVRAQARTSQAAERLKKVATSTARDSDAVTRAFLEVDNGNYESKMRSMRSQYLKKASWAELGDRCSPGALRIFPSDTSPTQREITQQLVERMEQTVLARGVGARLDTPAARALLRVIVGWESGIDRPRWDGDDKPPRLAFATGLTGEVPDPRGDGCLKSPAIGDTVTFVVPGFESMEFPKAPAPRVKAYFGPQAQQRVRDEFFAAVGSKDVAAELSYIVIAPVLIWSDWALVAVDRPREKGGVELGASSGGAVYLMRRAGSEWRLLSVVRSWGS